MSYVHYVTKLHTGLITARNDTTGGNFNIGWDYSTKGLRAEFKGCGILTDEDVNHQWPDAV